MMENGKWNFLGYKNGCPPSSIFHFAFSIIIIAFLLIGFRANAQPTVDTIKDCLKQSPHLFGKLDSHDSFISNGRAKILGVKFGLSYGSRLYFGLGYNQLYPPAKKFDKQVYFVNADNLADSATALLQLFYFSAQVEYVYYQNNNWQLSIPVQLGFGKTFYQYQLSGEKKEVESTFVLIYEPAVSVEYKFAKWFGVGADVGFRFIVTDYRRSYQKFNSPTYAFKLLIYYHEIYKSFTNQMNKKVIGD